MKFTKQIKLLWDDFKAMRSGLPANQYELGRFNELFGHYSQMFSGNHYDASNTGRLQDDWTTSYNTPYWNLSSHWKTIIARTIKAIDNNPHAKSIVVALVSNVIGTGLRPEPRVKTKDGKPVEGINKALAEGFKRYNDEWDATGKNTFLESQQFLFSEIINCGTVLTNKVPAKKDNYLQVANQVISALRLDTSRDMDNPNYDENPVVKRTAFGINMNEYGMPVSYWINGVKNPISSKFMRHYFKQTKAEQQIGEPWFSNSLKYLWANEKLIEDKLIASRIQAMIGLYVPNKMMNNLLKQQLNSDGKVKWEPGKIFYGDPGSKPEVIQADDSIKETLEPLQRLLLHAIATTFGISYQTVTRDLVKTNMASGKINTNEDRRTYKIIQKWFSKEVCQYEWNEFVFRMVSSGRVPNLSVSQYLADPWKYNQVQWRPNGWDFIDPSREASAIEKLYKNKMITLDSFYSERGIEWKDALNQLSEEKKMMDELGLTTIPEKDGEKNVEQEEPEEIEEVEEDKD